MSCKLKHKESLLNSRDFLIEQGAIDKKSSILNTEKFNQANTQLTEDALNAYGVQGTLWIDKDSRAIPNHSVLKQIDNKRKELGIYDSQDAGQVDVSRGNEEITNAVIKNNNNVNFQLIDSIDSKAKFNENLDNKLIGFLNSLNIDVKVSTLEDIYKSYGVNAVGVADLINKVITLSDNRNKTTLPEETGHIIMMLLGNKNEDVITLMNNIEKWEKYKDVENKYLPIYKSKEKVRFEAAGKYIAEVLVESFENKFDNFLVKLIKKLINHFKEKFHKFKGYENAGAKLVNLILTEDTTGISKNIKKDFIQVDINKALENNPNALRVHNYMRNLPVWLTGSLAISKSNTIYRDVSEQIHDLDYSAKSDEVIEIIGKNLERKFGATPVHNGIITSYSYCKTWAVPAENYEFAEISRYNTGWKKGTLRSNTILRNKLTNKYYYYHPDIVTTVDIFQSEIEGEEGVHNFVDVFLGKLNMGRKSDVFFNRPKDQLDYINLEANNQNYTIPDFVYFDIEDSKDKESEIIQVDYSNKDFEEQRERIRKENKLEISDKVQYDFRVSSQIKKNIDKINQWSKQLKGDAVFNQQIQRRIDYGSNIQGNKNFQKLSQEELQQTVQEVTKRHRSITALKDMAHKLAHRIGGKVEFENKTDADWKGYNQGMTSVLNEAYMTPDTPFHEILAHPIIRAIKNRKTYYKTGETAEFHGYGEPYRVTIEKIYDDTLEADIIDNKGNKQKVDLFELSKTQNTLLYQSLLKELETGRGKEVFEQVKRDYTFKKDVPYMSTIDKDVTLYYDKNTKTGYIHDNNNPSERKTFNSEQEVRDYLNLNDKYTLEEQQEEAIVTLLGMMAADKLDAKKDATLISKLKELWKQISDFVRSLLRQDGIKIDELPITTTLNDLAEIMAYGNNKIILPGYKVEYSTPLGNKYDTLEEVNQEIRGLANDVEVDLSGVNLPKSKLQIMLDKGEYLYYKKINGKWFNLAENNEEVTEQKVIVEFQNSENSWNNIDSLDDVNDFIELTNQLTSHIEGFIEKNKEYEQSKEIIEQWKKENNIQYDPEEVYSRGQGFYSSIGAYSNLELDLLLKNLIQHIQDNKKAGGEFTISAFTKPIDKRLKHIEGTGERVRFVIYPKSEHIKWAAPTDVYSGSVWDAHEKVSKDKKSELLGVSFTKAPALRNISEVSPNLADIIDNLSHAHNELGIELTTNNFRIEYDDDIDYSTKKLIDNINKILDDKYGKLEKSEIRKEVIESEEVYELQWKNGNLIGRYNSLEAAKKAQFGEYTDSEGNKISAEEATQIVKGQPIEKIGKQPTQTRENTTSIESVKKQYNFLDTEYGTLDLNKEELISAEDYLDSLKTATIILNDSSVNNEYVNANKWFINIEGNYPNGNFNTKKEAEDYLKEEIQKAQNALNKLKSKLKKEYTSQAEINLKVAALKEVARKYSRSLITTKVVPINPNLVNNGEIQYSKREKIQNIQTEINQLKQELERVETDEYGYEDPSDSPVLTSYYSNLTVPGGTNYTENEIATPGVEVQEKPQGVTPKQGIEDVFKSNPELSNIGTQEQYSQYLDTIFPDSKVKDIVYHGYKLKKDDHGRDDLKIEKFDKSKAPKGFYFTTDKDYANTFTEKYTNVKESGLIKAVVNLKNPKQQKDLFRTDPKLATAENKDGFIGNDMGFENENVVVVFEPEQIHILGGKQDIEGFKKWIKDNTITEVQESDVEAKVRELEKEGLLEIDCKGKLKAEKGLQTNFTKGGKWKLIKDLKGYPTHKEGGVDLTIGKNGVSIRNGNTEFTAKHGLVITKN